ncbi:hypothetical protein G5C51_12910 [Streptomyces sp. A7024]|uniref:DNA helicase DnaB-like N-terminal domain-containing protein n=1 Tax=Streptomyces coryli TaxID=1128680 RepID=A0A6G4TZB6_9ACTN|nr:DnaB-like helicase N-terminal domain-containing protein [Streptomyces coryli]NGN64796.1 hypothetical protein [Streptomyces coryli]
MVKTLVATPDPEEPEESRRGPAPADGLQDVYAEMQVLGAMLRHADVRALAATVLDASMFTAPHRRRVFSACVRIRGRGQVPAAGTVAAEMHGTDKAAMDEAADYMRGLVAKTAPQPVATHYVAIVRDLAAYRALAPAVPPTLRSVAGGAAEFGAPSLMRGFLIDENDD